MRILFVLAKRSKMSEAMLMGRAKDEGIPLEWDAKAGAWSVEMSFRGPDNLTSWGRVFWIQRLYNSGDCEPLKVRKARG
jgi:hypothetical protein